MPNTLNYRHLRYFQTVAEAGTLSEAARRLNLSPSALSVQLAQLEAQIGQALFERRGRSLLLTEAGRVALDYAGQIFRTGDELVGVLKHLSPVSRRVLRVGMVATLSRNFAVGLLEPVIHDRDAELTVRSGTLEELVQALGSDALDLVLSNLPAPHHETLDLQSRLIDEQHAALVGVPSLRPNAAFPQALDGLPLLLPGRQSGIRMAFDRLVEAAAVRPQVLAQVDDMAMLRVLARSGAGAALVPPIVVTDELESGQLAVLHRFDDIRESFYAVTRRRRFPNPLLVRLLEGR